MSCESAAGLGLLPYASTAAPAGHLSAATTCLPDAVPVIQLLALLPRAPRRPSPGASDSVPAPARRATAALFGLPGHRYAGAACPWSTRGAAGRQARTAGTEEIDHGREFGAHHHGQPGMRQGFARARHGCPRSVPQSFYVMPVMSWGNRVERGAAGGGVDGARRVHTAGAISVPRKPDRRVPGAAGRSRTGCYVAARAS